MAGEARPRPRMDRDTLRRLAALRSAERTVPVRDRARPVPLTPSQERLWFLDRAGFDGSTYLLWAGQRLKGPLDAELADTALKTVVARHEALRTGIVETPGGPVQVVHDRIVPQPPAHEGALPTARGRTPCDPPGEADPGPLLPLVDLRDAPPGTAEAVTRALTAAPMDLARPPLLRAALLRLAPDDHVLLLCIHHIVSDGPSTEVVVQELFAAYRALLAGEDPVAALPEAGAQFPDYAVWLADRGTGRSEAARAHWREHLHGAPALLGLPADRPRPATPTLRGDRCVAELEPGLSEALRDLARREQCTLFMVFLAAFAAVLARVCDEDDVVVGTPVANRDLQQLQRSVGMYVNTLALRADLSGDPTLAGLLDQVKETAVAGLEHQMLPFDQVVDLLRVPRDLSYNPVFQAMLVVEPGAPPVWEPAPGLTATGWSLPTPGARFDLTLCVVTGERIGLNLDYAADLFDAATAERLTGHLVTVLTAMAERLATPVWEVDLAPRPADGIRGGTGSRVPEVRGGPDGWADDAPARTGAGRTEAGEAEAGHTGAGASEAGRTEAGHTGAGETEAGKKTEAGHTGAGETESAGRPVHELVAAQAARTPDAPAILSRGRTLTYGELDRRANHLAHLLAGVPVAGRPVGVLVSDVPDAVVAILAALKAGGSYLPLDPAHPPVRLAGVLDETDVPVLLASEGTAVDPALLGHGSRTLLRTGPGVADTPPPVPPARPADLAYTIFTSGSTGRPKGVMITHGTLSRFNRSFVDAHRFGPADRVLMLPPLTFDASVGDLFPALTSGASLALHPEPALLDGPELVRFCAELEVTAVDAPAALWRRWGDDLAGHAVPEDWPVRLMMIGGERASTASARAWARATGGRIELVNHYGPTEATVCATTHHTVEGPEDAAHLPIGLPLDHVRAYVLDRRGRPSPAGTPGELHLGGECLARGYAGQAGLTAARFVPDPHSPTPGARMYRTGDLARLRADGTLEFLGRADGQVKINGYLVEPAEVEAALSEHPEVLDCAVTTRPDAAGHHRLIAYVVTGAGEPGHGGDGMSASSGGDGGGDGRDGTGAGIGDRARTGDGSGGRDAGSPVAGLRRWLRGRLPDYLVPAVFVPLERIPHTAHGKTDLAALPDPADLPGPSSHEPPTGPTETALAEIWERVLDVKRVGRSDNFFTAGGHSLRVAEVIAEIDRSLGVRLPMRALFEAADLAELAELTDAAAAESGAAGTAGAGDDDADLRAEAVLPADVVVRARVSGTGAGEGDAPAARARGAEREPWRSGPPGTVLLTGATGFLGAHLTAELLARTPARLVCLVRADSAAHALRRVRDNLTRHGLDPAVLGDRVTGLPGDLAAPRLGLDDSVLAELAATVDVVCHNGGLVNFAQPYAMLRPANVAGTLEVLRLAAAGGGLPVHHVSTLGVYLGSAYRDLRVTEADPPDDPDGLYGGYNRSKWVADSLVRQARSRGIPVTVHRPARVTGDSRSGVGVPEDYFTRLLVTFAQVGLVPALSYEEDLFPVDLLAAGVASAVAEPPAGQGEDIHYFNPATMGYDRIAEALREHGHPARTVPWEEWRDEVAGRLAAGDDLAIGPFAGVVAGPEPTFPRPLFDCRATHGRLAALGIVCPPADSELLGRYLGALVASGHLPSPQGAS
ncbi:non-ribosomal peptide synthetase [Streptosporangium carneum]|nr:non-ribosomal peptide synthetase [Streptosporangium carneum]